MSPTIFASRLPDQISGIAVVFFAIAMAGSVLPASAQEFPAGKPVRLLIGFPPGGGTDIQARQVAPKIADALGVPVLVENKPGASTMIAGQEVAKAGSTGRSTGAHVHYEILVNGRFVDPLRLKLPRGRVLDGPVLSGFDAEREKVDAMMARAAASRVAGAAQAPQAQQAAR